MVLLVAFLSTLVCLLVVGLILLKVYLRFVKLKKHASATELQLQKETEQQQVLSTELMALKEKLVHGVLHDSLTELPGRRVFEDRLVQIFNQSKRYQLLFAVMFIDLDGFKVVNDALGYEVGDELLKEVSLRLQKAIRQVDTVSRFSSDEFVVIAAQLTKPEAAAYVAQRIIDSISQPFRVQTQELFITASIGVATFPADGDEPMVILKNAHTALHQAKSHGNCYQFYRPEMHALSKRELMLNTSLQNAKIYSEFRVFYQPQIDIEKKKITCMHALLSWQHPDFGILFLDDFLRQAENNGKILEIGDWFIRNAMQQFLQWKKGDVYLDAIAMSVSPRQLENPHFAYKISQLFQEMHIEPSCLILEIPETALLTKLDVIEKVFHMLKHLGVRITIKEFGIGHLSLQHLKRFPIDSLKIATSLVQGVTVNKDNETIIKMAVAIASSLHIAVSAEGVESQKQLQLLKDLGCHIVQGNLFSVPLPAEEMTTEKIDSLLP